MFTKVFDIQHDSNGFQHFTRGIYCLKIRWYIANRIHHTNITQYVLT